MAKRLEMHETAADWHTPDAVNTLYTAAQRYMPPARGECLPPVAGGTPQTPKKSFKLETRSLLCPYHGYTRPVLVPRHGLGARQTGLGARARDKILLEFRVSILDSWM